MIKRKWWIYALLIIPVIGCNSRVSPPSDKGLATETSNGPDLRKEYGLRALKLLDEFDVAAKNAEFLDDKTLDRYIANKALPMSVLDRLNQGLAREMKLIETVQALHPPPDFQTFHNQLLKNLEQRADNLSGLILAIESGDHRKVIDALNQAQSLSLKRRKEMDAILGGKTAEKYLGVE